MAMSEYWVGEIPAAPLRITIVDEDNNPIPLGVSSSFTARILGSDNEEVDTTGAVILNTGLEVGTLTFKFPLDRSLFNKAGEYLLQIEIDGVNGTKEFTDAHLIRVRKFGGKN